MDANGPIAVLPQSSRFLPRTKFQLESRSNQQIVGEYFSDGEE
jgi:hypothetical protein